MGLLPEVYRRKLYEKKSFSSVFEFAKKLAGLSGEQVRTILNLGKKFENDNGLKKLLFEKKSLPGQTSTLQKFPNGKLANELQLSNEVQQKLLELQQKGIDVNELILEMLQKRKLEIAQEKEKISTQLPQTTSRYIPVQIKKIINKEHGTKCSIQTCQKPAENLHHTQRFALARVHDPRYLAPLCKNRNIIAHRIDLNFQRKRATVIT